MINSTTLDIALYFEEYPNLLKEFGNLCINLCLVIVTASNTLGFRSKIGCRTGLVLDIVRRI